MPGSGGARAIGPPSRRTQLALEKLELEPVVDLSMRLGEGTGAAVALPVVRAAVATLASMATFDEASVSS